MPTNLHRDLVAAFHALTPKERVLWLRELSRV